MTTNNTTVIAAIIGGKRQAAIEFIAQIEALYSAGELATAHRLVRELGKDFGRAQQHLLLDALEARGDKDACQRIFADMEVRYDRAFAVHAAALRAGRWDTARGSEFAPFSPALVELPIVTAEGGTMWWHPAKEQAGSAAVAELKEQLNELHRAKGLDDMERVLRAVTGRTAWAGEVKALCERFDEDLRALSDGDSNSAFKAKRWFAIGGAKEGFHALKALAWVAIAQAANAAYFADIYRPRSAAEEMAEAIESGHARGNNGVLYGTEARDNGIESYEVGDFTVHGVRAREAYQDSSADWADKAEEALALLVWADELVTALIAGPASQQGLWCPQGATLTGTKRRVSGRSYMGLGIAQSSKTLDPQLSAELLALVDKIKADKQAEYRAKRAENAKAVKADAIAVCDRSGLFA